MCGAAVGVGFNEVRLFSVPVITYSPFFLLSLHPE